MIIIVYFISFEYKLNLVVPKNENILLFSNKGLQNGLAHATLFVPVSCKDSVRSIWWKFPLHRRPFPASLVPSLPHNPWAFRRAAVSVEWLSPAGSMLPVDCWEQCRKLYTLRLNLACNQSNPHSDKYTKDNGCHPLTLTRHITTMLVMSMWHHSSISQEYYFIVKDPGPVLSVKIICSSPKDENILCDS